MPADTQTTLPELPPGYRILNDGPDREVLVRDEWDNCPVFDSYDDAFDWAWTQHKEYGDG